jgi:hypothetical protein
MNELSKRLKQAEETSSRSKMPEVSLGLSYIQIGLEKVVKRFPYSLYDGDFAGLGTSLILAPITLALAFVVDITRHKGL